MNVLGFEVNLWILLPLIFLTWVFTLASLKKIVFAVIRKLTEKTENKLDDLLLEALEFPVQIIVYASGVLVVNHFLPAGPQSAEILKVLYYAFKIVCIVAGVAFVDKFLRGLIVMYAETVEVLKTSSGIAQGVVKVVVMGLGGLILLDTFGVSITPIIASLGIGSLAVALALQPTLENFFSGIQIIADKPVQLGQFIKLESGEEGTVQKIGWRSTWITLPNNNTIVIPNKLLVNSRVTNYFYPSTEMVVPINVGVHYNSNLERVEAVTLEVARQTLKEVEGGVKTFEPVLRFTTLADSSIVFTIVLRAKDVGGAAVVKHEFLKRLMKRYSQEEIIIPYPTRHIVSKV